MEDEEKNAEEDLKKVKSVLNFVNPDVEVSSLTKIQIFRCGQRRRTVGAKPRTIKVLFPEPASKGKILKQAKKLKDHPTFSKVGLSYDKTKSELEKDRLLREEFLKRKSNGEDVVRYRGQVVLRSEIDSLSNEPRGAVGGALPPTEEGH
jgi:hypothetical protein